MKNLKFKYASAKNFICFKEKIELDFTKYKNIVLIKGENHDMTIAGKPGSNGSGKTTCIDIISFALYGKIVKSSSKVHLKDVFHQGTNKGLEVELIVDDYRILRRRGPDSIQVWKSSEGIWNKSTEITRKNMQSVIDNEIIGLSHDAFCNVVVFDDGNTSGFIDANAASKRNIIENLLNLEKFSSYLDKTKKLVKEFKDKVKIESSLLENMFIDHDRWENQLNKIKEQDLIWNNNKNKSINELNNKLKDIKEKLNLVLKEQSEDTEVQNIQELIEKYKLELEILSNKENKLKSITEELNSKLESIHELVNNQNLKSHDIKLEIKKCESIIEQHKGTLSSVDGISKLDSCPVCYGKVNESNYSNIIKHSTNIITSHEETLKQLKIKLDLQYQETTKTKENLSKLNETLKLSNKGFSEINNKKYKLMSEIDKINKIKKRDYHTEISNLEEFISNIDKQIEETTSSVSPYKDMFVNTELNLNETNKNITHIKSNITEIEKELPYYEYFINAFNDHGIRKFAIDEIIPCLNVKVNEWLSYLMDGQIKIEFNNELEEKITQLTFEEQPFLYYLLSNGEKRRIDLAISQAFAYIRSLSYGSYPSICFLDEITKGAIDLNGVYGLFNMIQELAKERQVFITTHDTNLFDLLEPIADTILLRKNNGSTVLVEK